MSNLINKVKSHLPHSGTHHQQTTGTTLPSTIGGESLHQTYHNEQNLQGPRPGTLTHTKEDHWEGGNLNKHESVVKKETIVEPKQDRSLPRAAPLVQQSFVQPVVVPMAQNVLPATRTFVEPAVSRNVVEKATIVKETLLPEERIEIQPVIHREREQKEVHKVVQPLHEKDILPTKVVQATLAEQVRAPIVESDAAYQVRSREADTRFVSTKEYAGLKSQTVQKPAIVEERVHKTIIEEVQPVLYKETVVPVIIQETQPIYEKIVEAPIVITEERAMRDLGTQFASTSFNGEREFSNMGQGVIPPQSFVQTTTTQIIREEIPLSGQQWNQTSQLPGQQFLGQQQFPGQLSGQQLPGQQWNQTASQFPNQQWTENQQLAGGQLPNQQWNQASQLGGQTFADQKIYQQNASLQKNPLQPNVSNTKLV
eukprot:TRINITY_DN352_c0_g1_i4.p1 TRINITY_DN352_c0_g1~~TRINITY_DN352_c0_g1_i4.p1  ORF type:complete len:451 (+),score=143.35 TRINITY_DN352_c0_g1_i4:80-1354(+)